MTDVVDEYLAHFGVKGMKWGVRKEYSSSENQTNHRKLTKNQKRAVIGVTAAVAVGAIVAAGILANKSYQNRMVSKSASEFLSDLSANAAFSEKAKLGKEFVDSRLSGGDTYIPKGTNFFRTASRLETHIDSPKYATYINTDAASYRKSWGSTRSSELFKTKISTLANSKIAGRDSMVSLGQELLGGSKIKGSSGFRESVISDLISNGASKDRISGLNNKDLMDYWLDVKRGGSWESKASSSFFDYLSRNGYSGITDEVDTGRSKHAVVMINDAITKVTGSELTKFDKEAARRLYKSMLENGGSHS